MVLHTFFQKKGKNFIKKNRVYSQKNVPPIGRTFFRHLKKFTHLLFFYHVGDIVFHEVLFQTPQYHIYPILKSTLYHRI